MNRYAIFVDAGYFFMAGAQAAFGLRTPPITRRQISVKSSKALLDDLCCEAAATTGNNIPLLRVYWYDAMPGTRMSLDQSNLALLSGVKMRLGALNSVGKQKGVDSLIVTDIIDLARNQAICDAVVVTGDDDLRIAFQVAQSLGVRVHILAAGDPTKNVNPALQMEADSIRALDSEWFRKHLDLNASVNISSPLAAAPVMPSSKALPASQPISIDAASNAVITEMLTIITPEHRTQLAAHFITQRTIPPEYDRPLIAKVSHALSGQRLSHEEKRRIRFQFINAVKNA
ncbi:MAG: NYN domain-containing protein [Acidithiobacillus sp.]|nr:NYN domain-containing protein [Acidithiobacillus sp.]